MEEIKVADTARYVSFYAYDSADHISPADGITGFTVYYYLNNGSATVMTTPTITEKDSTNMKGWYTLAVDEAGMVSAEGISSINIEATGMDPVAIKINVVGNTTKETYDRIGAPVGASISADLVVIDNFVDNLESRLTAARAGYLDNLSAGAVALAATALTDVTWTDAKAAFLDHSIATVDTNVDTLLTRITAAVALASVCTETRLAELDAANLPSDVDNTYFAASSTFTIVNSGVHGNAALKALIDTIDGIVDSILLDTAEIGAAGASLTDLGGMSTGMQTEVNNQVVDVIRTDTTSEMSQGAPPVDPTMEEMVAYLYFRLRNKRVVTETEDATYDDAGTTKLFKSAIEELNDVFTKSEYVSGA